MTACKSMGYISHKQKKDAVEWHLFLFFIIISFSYKIQQAFQLYNFISLLFTELGIGLFLTFLFRSALYYNHDFSFRLMLTIP